MSVDGIYLDRGELVFAVKEHEDKVYEHIVEIEMQLDALDVDLEIHVTAHQGRGPASVVSPLAETIWKRVETNHK